MKRKHKPARPHWERVTSRRANNKNVVETPTQNFGYYYSNEPAYRRDVRPANAAPGK